MRFIKNILFGRKIIFNDPLIGALTTRIKSENPSIEYTWNGESLLPGQKSKTVFILEGNAKGPYKLQLESVSKIIQDLDNICATVDSQLKVISSKKHDVVTGWLSEFYLAAITPNDVPTNEFEITFEPTKSDDLRYVSFLWTNGKISEIETK